jgi:hypothetical protein
MRTMGQTEECEEEEVDGESPRLEDHRDSNYEHIMFRKLRGARICANKNVNL